MFCRRHFLAGLAGLAASPILPALGAKTEGTELIVSTATHAGGRFAVAGFEPSGHVRFALALPGRGHGLAARPSTAEAVVVARRPGAYLMIVDVEAGRVVRTVANAEGRHFNGHGVHSADGRMFYASETEIESGAGLLGIYDAGTGYRRLGEVPSGGLDPHDIRLIDNSRTLVIANGGVMTHPDAPKTVLNLDSMDPTLAYLDATNGNARAVVHQSPMRRWLGIRHLAVGAGDRVAIAMQYVGPAADTVPLVALHRPGDPAFRFLDLPAQTLSAIRHYCGGAAVDASGTVLGVSCPKGNMFVFFMLKDGRYIGKTDVADGCGIAPASNGFVLTSGVGGVFSWHPDATAQPTPGRFLESGRWDNHAIRMTLSG